jgi:hypothetical protein
MKRKTKVIAKDKTIKDFNIQLDFLGDLYMKKPSLYSYCKNIIPWKKGASGI